MPSKRIALKLLENNKIMGENQVGVTMGIEEHLFTVQLIVSRQETEFEQTVCSCQLRKGI